MIGKVLAHYRIVEQLGVGGMGEVYLAEDTKLGRRVAIKVLPEHLSSDPDRMARFEREARVLASLNHPHIAAIHGLEEIDEIKFLVLELIDGETLEQRIERGAIPIHEALPIMAQIAVALETAHESGVIHRDLKPANVKIREDGQVKVLDFGLAKVHDPIASNSGPSLSRSPTLTHGMTVAGALLGTAAYMSPEQARAREVDKRADIWAFGCVLYEMLTGRKAFGGETVSDTMAAILKEQPDRDALPRGTPLQVQRLLSRCLEKDAKQRLRDIGDARIAIQEAIDAPATELAIDRPVGRKGMPWWLALAALAAVGATAFFVGSAGQDTAPQEPPRFQRVTFGDVSVQSARFAPDGESILYTARVGDDKDALFMTRRGNPESTSLGHEDAELVSVSPSGELAMIRSGSTLARAPMNGGALRDVAEDISDADWSPDGSELAVMRESGGSWVIEYPIGTPRYETSSNLMGPRLSPDGRTIGSMELVGGRWTPVVTSLDDGTSRYLAGSLEGISGGAWHPSGQELWFSGGDVLFEILAAPVHEGGELRVVARAPASILLQDIAPNGDVLAILATRRGFIRRGSSSGPEEDASWLGSARVSDISGDGQTLLMTVIGEAAGDKGAIYLQRSTDTTPVRIGEGVAVDLSHDGEWVLAVTLSAPERVVLLPTGAGSARQLDLSPLDNFEDVNFLPDGRRILLQGNEGDKPRQLFLYDLEAEELTPVTEIGTTYAWSTNAPISPDGQHVLVWVAAENRLDIQRIDGGDTALAGVDFGGDYPAGWAGDDAMFLATRTSRPDIEIVRLDLTTGKRTPWRVLEVPADTRFGGAAMTPDGEHYAVNLTTSTSALYVIQGLR